ncbi:hypothetical protein [Aquimarina rhabdastrellae]
MAYRDDFYKKANIIGYTGTIGSNETVYFKDGNEYGHITQDHNFVTNIGRETVRSASDYKIENRSSDGRCQESANGVVFHVSRNPFIAVDSSTIDQLADAITNKTEEKEYPKNGGILIDKNGRKFKFSNGKFTRV